MWVKSIFEYSDYRAYLRDWFLFKKTDANYTYANFANEAGFQSRSYLRLVITNKRNLSIDAIEKFIFALRLTSQEARGFRTLVQANQSTEVDERAQLWKKFLDLRPISNQSQTLKDSFLYLSHFINPTLKLLLSLNETQDWTPQQFATFLHCPLEQVEEALTTFENLGLISEAKNCPRRISPRPINTTDDIPNVAIQSFHKKALSRAIEAIDLPVEQREFQAVVFGLNQEGFLYLRQRLRDLAIEIDQLYSKNRSTIDRIYLLNLNLVPVTSSIIQENSHHLSQREELSTELKGEPNANI